ALPTAREDSGEDVVADRAEPYDYDYRDRRFLHAVQIEKSVSSAADGGVLLSARGTAPWAGARAGHPPARPARMAEGASPVGIANGRQFPYGFGWFLERTRGHDLRQHAGRVPGFGALLMHLPADALWVAVMANTTPPPPMQLMALTAAEAFSPGSTFLSLPSAGDARDPLTLRGREMFERGPLPPNPDRFAPQMQVRLRARVPALPQPLPAPPRLQP